MSNPVLAKVQERNAQLATDKIADAVKAALCDALIRLSEIGGEAELDAFLRRRLSIIASLRRIRDGEPPGLVKARERDAAAGEAALREIVARARNSGLRI